MNKGKTARLVGFTAALGATATLVSLAATGTGAYFSESHPGNINASTGGVHANTTDLQLNFSNLLPGDTQTNPVSYQATGSGPEDIWLVLPTNGAGAFDGPGGSDEALGRYGHFAVSSPAGSFTSYNLAAAHPGDEGSTCSIDGNGHGGSDEQATRVNGVKTDIPYCPVPDAILLDSNLTNGQGGTAQVSFGFTKLLEDPSQEDTALSSVSPFRIVATQHGIRPDDPNSVPVS